MQTVRNIPLFGQPHDLARGGVRTLEPRTLDASSWLKMLRRWLERRVEAEVEELQARRKRNERTVRKAEAIAWYFSQP
jgi:hypothetical protein